MTKELNFNVLVTEKFKQRYKFSLTINIKKKLIYTVKCYNNKYCKKKLFKD